MLVLLLTLASRVDHHRYMRDLQTRMPRWLSREMRRSLRASLYRRTNPLTSKQAPLFDQVWLLYRSLLPGWRRIRAEAASAPAPAAAARRDRGHIIVSLGEGGGIVADALSDAWSETAGHRIPVRHLPPLHDKSAAAARAAIRSAVHPLARKRVILVDSFGASLPAAEAALRGEGEGEGEGGTASASAIDSMWVWSPLAPVPAPVRETALLRVVCPAGGPLLLPAS